MKLKTLIQAGCGFLAFVFLFLPWCSGTALDIYGYSMNAFFETALGVFALLASLAALAWFVLKILVSQKILNIKLPVAKNEKIIDTCAGGLIALFGVIGFIVAFANNSELIKAHPSVGTYFYIICGVAIIVLTWVKLEQTVGKAPKKAAKAEKKEAEKDEK